jgi:hypothetical protein
MRQCKNIAKVGRYLGINAELTTPGLQKFRLLPFQKPHIYSETARTLNPNFSEIAFW